MSTEIRQAYDLLRHWAAVKSGGVNHYWFFFAPDRAWTPLCGRVHVRDELAKHRGDRECPHCVQLVGEQDRCGQIGS